MQNTNSMRDEIRLQREKLNGQPFAMKLNYYWGYYKVHAIIIILAACIFGSLLHSILTQKETVLSVAYVNAFPNINDELFMDEFESYLGINTRKQQTILDSTYYIDDTSTSPYAATYEQKFSAMAMAGQLDVVVADEKKFDFYGKQGFFQDLRPLLTPEQLEQYEDLLFYCDIPDDESSDPVPVGINITNANKICSTESYPNNIAIYGIITNSKYVDNALSYLNYLEQ